MNKSLSAHIGDERFRVPVQSPTAWESYVALRQGKSQAETINKALAAVANKTDPAEAFTELREEWGTNKSETVREALRRAAMSEVSQ
jgi:hypothetical protein